MTRFEEVGRKRLQCAPSSIAAIKDYAHSCAICCARGYRIECDRCAIKETYNFVMEFFNPPKDADKIPARA